MHDRVAAERRDPGAKSRLECDRAADGEERSDPE
jgi:hypothetical protein